jgi:IPT/TIG domain
MTEQRSWASTFVFVVAGLLFVAGAGMLGYVALRPSGPRVFGLDPARVRAGDAITVRGQGFAPNPQGNIVLFGDQTGRVISATESDLRVEVPDIGMPDGATQGVGLRVLVGRTASDPFDLAVYREPAPPIPLPAEGEPEVVAALEAPPAVVAAIPPSTQAAEPQPPGPASPARRRPAPASPAPPATTTPEAPRPRPPAAEPAAPPAPHRFVPERTAAESRKRVNGGLDGFDASTVDMKRAPEIVGRVHFEVAPGQVKAGERYTVNVFLINDGSKAIGIKQVFVATSVNGRLSSAPMAFQSDQVAPRKRVLLGSLSDVWRDTTTSWAMDVTVTSDRGDVYKNQIVWK